MGYTQYFYLLAAALVAAVAYLAVRLWRRRREKAVPESCTCVIRVTDQQGRDMVIIRKEDGSFEMKEEREFRK